jgi:hypothetical protein
MKMVYTNENNFLVNNTKNLIEAAGINAFIKNEFIKGAMGEISIFETWPEVWIYDDTNLELALAIVDKSQNGIKQEDWLCNTCSEENPSSFEICWHCQSERS